MLSGQIHNSAELIELIDRIGFLPLLDCGIKGFCAEDDDVIQQVAFLGGCNGNLQGISRLVAGQKIDDVIARLNGIDCGGKGTSCPDQLCRALEQLKQS